MKKVILKKDSYFDSVFLMLLSKQLNELPVVNDAVVAMGTPMNLELLGDSGYPNEDYESAGPNDLIIAVDCVGDEAVHQAFGLVDSLLSKKGGTTAAGAGGKANPRSLSGALELLPNANLAVISLPGAYAAREVRKAFGERSTCDALLRQRQS